MVKELKYTVIKSLNQYTNYCNIYEKLMSENESRHQEELELLSLLITEYDNRINPEIKLNPVQLLQSLLEDLTETNTSFAKSIKISPQLLSDILNYRRSISKSVVIKLAKRFKMREEAFSRPYPLK